MGLWSPKVWLHNVVISNPAIEATSTHNIHNAFRGVSFTLGLLCFGWTGRCRCVDLAPCIGRIRSWMGCCAGSLHDSKVSSCGFPARDRYGRREATQTTFGCIPAFLITLSPSCFSSAGGLTRAPAIFFGCQTMSLYMRWRRLVKQGLSPSTTIVQSVLVSAGQPAASAQLVCPTDAQRVLHGMMDFKNYRQQISEQDVTIFRMYSYTLYL